MAEAPPAAQAPIDPSLLERLTVGHVAPVVAAPVTIVIFGGAGDLARRKLLPALYNLYVDGLLPSQFAAVGVGRTAMSDDAYRAAAREGVTEFSRRQPDDRSWEPFARSLFFVEATLDDPRSFATLGARLDIIEHERGIPANRVYYLAVPSTLFVPTVNSVAAARLVARGADRQPFARLVVEKPIGRDLATACAIDDEIAKVFDESQIFRIDHYLGKETVQNILVLRFANSIFEPLFNKQYVDHVQITVAEAEGVGTRAGYYEQAGALRDMVQNHLLQLLTLVATEPPHSLDADAVRDEKLEIIESLRPIRGADVNRLVVRGRYGRGHIMGEPVRGYLEEDGVARNSRIETYVALETHVDNWRWSGVPFFLRTGKRLPKRASEIAVAFKEVPPVLFNADPNGRVDQNVLSIRVQPDEGFALLMNSKVPGPRLRIYPVTMDFRYSSTFGSSTPEAYERLLLDVMNGDATLFMRRDAVEAAWRFVTPILEAWADAPDAPLAAYPAGEWGPADGDHLITSTGRTWRTL